ncbi:MAG: NAD(+) synthase, partial [Oscillospiraceae bacterium]|nr:NAD(+) synthase [Oscillospiraceae bacterium]
DDLNEIYIGGESFCFSRKWVFRHHSLRELTVACEIGSDLWAPNPPSTELAMKGATVIVNLSAIEEVVTRDDYRRRLIAAHSAKLVCGYICSEAGEGESTQGSVFAGHSIIAENGHILAESTAESGIIYSEIDVLRLDYERRRRGTFTGEYMSYYETGECTDTVLTRKFPKLPFVPDNPADRAKRCEQAIYLQCLGLKKRVQHTYTKKLVVGVSGGLDSTLAMLVCARTLKMMGRPADDLIAITMPGFGTTARTKSNAEKLSEALGAEFRTIPIGDVTLKHFEDIGHDPEDHSVVYENAQARERTQVLMDIANGCGGLVVGTGDMSELALGWATFNGDHMSMYGVNAGVPKTMMRYLVGYIADTDPELTEVLKSILDTPVSPELLPAENGVISQRTEDIIGPYELHDFFLYYGIRWGFEPKKVYRVAKYAFEGDYDGETILKWLKIFYRRFFAQQFKRTCAPDGPKIGTLTLSPGGDWSMPTDAASALWLKELEDIEF